MDYTVQRERMVDSQIRPNAVTDARILAAMLEIPREAYVPASQRDLAYLDEDIQVGSHDGKPRYLIEAMTFARLLQLADIDSDALVLDVGTTGGYTAAVISRLASAVVGLEADEEMAGWATSNLVEQGVDNVAVFSGPLNAGYREQGPYDAIILEGAVEEIPQTFFEQLREGGRLVAVVQDGPIGRATLFLKQDGLVSSSVAFDANVQPLPGFERAREFVF